PAQQADPPQEGAPQPGHRVPSRRHLLDTGARLPRLLVEFLVRKQATRPEAGDRRKNHPPPGRNSDPFLRRPDACHRPTAPPLPLTMAFLGSRPAARPAVTILGVPFDATSTFRAGSRQAPAAIRWA